MARVEINHKVTFDHLDLFQEGVEFRVLIPNCHNVFTIKKGVNRRRRILCCENVLA